MQEIQKLSENENYNAINLGDLNDLMNYSLIHPVNKQEIEGKVFLKDTMIYMVVQSKENSLEEHSTKDGERVPFKPKWKDK